MRIFQVLDALDFGDGVSNDVINKYNLLKELGYETYIYSKWTNEKVSKYRKNIDELTVKNDDILIHHFSGKSNILNSVLPLNCIKIMVYHNITPKSFFGEIKQGENCEEGEIQLVKIKDHYKFFLADSQYNKECLMNLGVTKFIDVLPVFIDFTKIIKANKWEIRDNPSEVILTFIGRVAPNKKHEDIIDIFEEYYTNINMNSKLMIVGNYEDYRDYYARLCDKIKFLNCKNAVVFTGKVNDDELYNYFKNGDIFICMSEHEGFCIPLLESMSCKVPTVAFNACAIESTMGGSGILVNKKNPKVLARLAHEIITNDILKKEIIDKQSQWVETFSIDGLKVQLQNLIRKWSEVR